MKTSQGIVHWINSALLASILCVLLFKPDKFLSLYDAQKEIHPIKRSKMIPAVAVYNSVDVSGSVEVTRMPSVEISPLSQPLEVTVEKPVKVEPEDWKGLPVRIER